MPHQFDLARLDVLLFELGFDRTGELAVGECSVVVVAAAPHRAEAFDAARWCIDTLKETAPIWKHETWEGGGGWGTGARPVNEVTPS